MKYPKIEGIKDCKIGLRVTDKSIGHGEIKEILKTRVKVKFDNKTELVTYDIPHLKAFLQYEEIYYQGNI